MLKYQDSEINTVNDDRAGVGLKDSLPLPHEGFSLMNSFVSVRDPSIRRLIVDLVVEMSKIGGAPQPSVGAS